MRAMLLIPLLLTSCAVVSEDGAVMLGGKGAAKGGGKTGGGWAMVWNGEKSFSDGALLIGTVATSGFAAASHKATEATNQVVARETTKRAAAVEATKRVGITTHGAAYGTAVGAELPGVAAPLPPVAP